MIRLSKGAFRLLRFFEAIHRYHRWIAPKVAYLMKRFQRSRATVLRWIAELKAAGYLSVQRRGRKAASFSLLRPLNETSAQTVLFTESIEGKTLPFRNAARRKPPVNAVLNFTDEDWTDIYRLARRWGG